MMAWVLALPELLGLLAVTTPLVLGWARNKKRLFLWASLGARAALLLIPLAVWQAWFPPLTVLLAGMVLAGICQAIAFTAYLSWLSDLAPEQSWGRFFSRRNMAQLAVLLIIPFLAALLRDWLKTSGYSVDFRMAVYAGTFCMGNMLQLLSLQPLLKWPAFIAAGPHRAHAAETAPVVWPVPRGSFVRVMLFSCWLAFFQGMTQTAFFLQGYRQLQLSLTVFFLLQGTMYLLQIPATWGAGRWSDLRGNRDLLMASTVVVSLAMLFWLATLRGHWAWLWGAYVLWGGFGAVNLTLQNLVLRVVPRHRNTLAIALYRFGPGFIAGLTGLVGGFWLERELNAEHAWSVWGSQVSPFFVLFAVSFLGRLLAPLILWGVREPEHHGP